jgi:hypothetical protein
MTAGFDVAAALRAWDGRDVRPFQDVAEALPATADNVAALLALARRDDAALQVGATWVLKHWLEQGCVLDRRASGRMAALLERELDWGAALHVLQALSRLDLSDARWGRLPQMLERRLDSPRPFVRAWAYNGLGLAAARNPDLRPRVEALFEQAMADEPASVRARIRSARRAWASGDQADPR